MRFEALGKGRSPVPTQYVTRVYTLLAELALKKGEMSSPLPGGTQGVEPDGSRPVKEWTAENFGSLIATDLPSIQRVAAILDFLAAEPERAYDKVRDRGCCVPGR